MKYSVGLVGASGLVGQTFLKILKENAFPIANLHLYGGTQSDGKIVKFNKKSYVINQIDENFSPKDDFVIFATDSSVSEKYIPKALKNSCTVVDNSSAFRLKKNVPLTVFDINFKKCLNKKLISNPNCSTLIAVKSINALQEHFKIENIRFTTFQSVSGAGRNGINALAKYDNNTFYGYDIRKTCVPRIGAFESNGYTTEELKMCFEIRKILNLPRLKISATCVRVPIKNCHAINVCVKLKEKIKINDIKEIFSNLRNHIVCDDINELPVATKTKGNNKILIGRIRKDLAEPNAITYYVVSDNLRQGAALNAFEIMKGLSCNESI